MAAPHVRPLPHRSRWRGAGFGVVRAVVAIGGLVSLVAALHVASYDSNRAYYGTDTRAYQLLAGAFLALTPQVFDDGPARPLVRAAHDEPSFAPLAALGAARVVGDRRRPGPRGALVTLVALGLLIVLETSAPTSVAGALRRAARLPRADLVRHVPVALDRDPRRDQDVFTSSSIATIGIACLVATGTGIAQLRASRTTRTNLAVSRSASRRGYHRRARDQHGRRDRPDPDESWIPLARQAPVAEGATTVGFTPVPANLDWQGAKNGGGPFITCLHKPVAACTVVHGTGRHVLLMGDSHAWMMIPAFSEIARRENLTLSVSVRGGCPWQRDLYVVPCHCERHDPAHAGLPRRRRVTRVRRVIPELAS